MIKKRFCVFLAVLMAITIVPLENFTAFAADQLDIKTILPDKVSEKNGKVVTITGTGFGSKIDDINKVQVVLDGGASNPTIQTSDILSINDTEMRIKLPPSGGFIGQAYLIVGRDGWGSDSILFNYVEDPSITNIITNTEISIMRDANGEVIKNPDGTAKRDKQTYIEIYGFYFNAPGEQNNIEEYVELESSNSTMSAKVISQKEGYIKAKLPENFIFGDTYKITIRNKFGGEAFLENRNITLAEHDITQLSNLKVNIGAKLGINGTNFPSNIKVYIGDENGEKEASIISTNTSLIEVTVPQVATTKYQNVKVVNTDNSTAVTLIDELEVLPVPKEFTVTAITPNAGTKLGGTEVRVIGTSLNPDMKILFGDKYATGVELDTEMSKDGVTVLKAKTPASTKIGSVDVKVINPIDNGQRVLANGYRYTEVENSLVVIDMNPTEGFETGGETVSISGINFQRTRIDDDEKVVSDENTVTLSADKKEVVFESTEIADYPKPGTNDKVNVIRTRKVKVYFGGELAEFKIINDDGTLDPDDMTIINPDSGHQILRVKTPQIALNPRENTPVNVTVEIITQYIDAADKITIIDQYAEKEMSPRKYVYKPVPSTPELKVVHNYKSSTMPLINDDLKMARAAAQETVYIYGYDFRPDAKVYFFKEGQKPLDELMVPKNQAQVIAVDTLEGSYMGKTINRIEVKAPDIKELGAVTVIVQNKDGARTKTLNEFRNQDGVTDKEIEVRQFEYVSTPIIKEVFPPYGSTNFIDDGELVIRNPRVTMNGEMFLVNAYVDENEVTTLAYPTIYVVPKSVSTKDIQSLHTVDPDSISKYRAEVIEVTKEVNDKLIKLDGVKDRVGTKMSVIMPSVAPDNGGYRDIIIINPDKGINRINDAFEYRSPETKPKIISIVPDKGSTEGGEKVVITGTDFEYDIKNILLLVTLDGEAAEIDQIERTTTDGSNTVVVTITTPKGTAGEKTLQVINPDGGTAEGKYTYTRVFTNPVITTIAPDHGGPLTKVIIKGDDFVVPDPNSSDEDGKHGTRVYFNNDEILTKTDSDGNVISDVYVVDDRTIYLVVPDGLPLGQKDVTVLNPDTSRYTVKNGFEYQKPDSAPEIIYITPKEGTRDGGTIVKIKGKGFIKSKGEPVIEVYFGEKKGINPRFGADETEIIVTTPSYPIDEKVTDRVTVPVTIVNYDGGSATIDDGFTFRVPGSKPKITGIDPNRGTTSGGTRVVIDGEDFRYKDVNSNGMYDEGDIAPKVYFAWEEAVEVIFSSHGRIIAITPEFQEGGAVDVTVVNPDAGAYVAKGAFTYEKSNPQITSITPPAVPKQGGTEIVIRGSGFIKNLEKDESDTPSTPDDPTKPIYGENIDVEVSFGNESDSSELVGKRAEVILGSIKVVYDGSDENADKNVSILLNEEEKTSFKINTGESKIVLLSTSAQGSSLEGIKIEVKDGNLIVTRRLSPEVRYIDSGKVEAVTPPMETEEEKPVDVILRNRDGAEGKGSIIITNPASNPEITDIDPKREINRKDSDKIDYYVVESTVQGGLVFTIHGKDFRKGSRVFIENKEAEIISRGPNDDSLVVRSPNGSGFQLNEPLRIIVMNTDGKSADSSLSKIGEKQARAYYIYRPTESKPTVEYIEPNSGSAAGGERIEIIGNDFREGNVTVRIGAKKATVVVEESSYKKLVVITPPSEILGPVDVFIRNESAMGEVLLEGGFTYYSAPAITRVNPNEVHNTGGHKVTISGAQFKEGVKVYIDDTEVKEVTYIDERTIEIITPAGEVGTKDIKIENTDGGSATLKNGITYILPVPESPSGFTATPGHERSIVLKWDETPGAERYKIFGKKRSKDEYKFIGETTDLEYYLKDLEEDTRYYFKLWALNKHGESLGYDYDSATTLKSKYDKGDDKYDQNETTETVLNYSNGAATIDLPSKYDGSEYTIDLTDTKYRSYNKVQINIPISAIKSGRGGVYVQTEDIMLRVPMYNLMFSTYFNTSKNESDSNVIITLTKLDNAEKSRLTKGLTRKEEAKSQAYGVSFVLQRGRDSEAISIKDGISLVIKVDKEGLAKDKLYMARYVPQDNKLQEHNSAITEGYNLQTLRENYQILAEVSEDGKFIVIYKK
ncbi:IPT/TIG domain-containing protein [Brassicibacter mesophilus]|uniref:IPT/TIG domain-containing protein n=1 Tax=Brassicibacter mesophilus TaxID=745119 RepID=UPI003D1E5E78